MGLDLLENPIVSDYWGSDIGVFHSPGALLEGTIAEPERVSNKPLHVQLDYQLHYYRIVILGYIFNPDFPAGYSAIDGFEYGIGAAARFPGYGIVFSDCRKAVYQNRPFLVDS
jgi:hypothetical protein